MPILPISEREFQAQVIELAHLNGWRVAHFRPSLNKRGTWQTAVAADGAGFPDLVLVRERVLWVELKTQTGKQSINQILWGEALTDALQEFYVWRPKDWDEIVVILGRS